MFTDAVIGFEYPSYTIDEAGGEVEVCIIVIDPPASEDLVYPINAGYALSRVTAGKFILLIL